MKKVSSVILVVAVLLLVATVGCGFAPESKATKVVAKDTQPEVAKIKPDIFGFGPSNARYNKEAFGGSDGEYFIYRFEDTDVVVFHVFGYEYLIGEWTEETEGTSYAHVTQDDSQFLALSDKYMLFLTSEGKVAVGLEEKEGQREDGKKYLFHETIPFENLPISEQENFVYPSSFERVEVPEEPKEVEEDTWYKRFIETIDSDWEFAC